MKLLKQPADQNNPVLALRKKYQKEMPQKYHVYTIFFREVGANFCLLPSDIKQELSRDCSEKLVQMKFFKF